VQDTYRDTTSQLAASRYIGLESTRAEILIIGERFMAAPDLRAVIEELVKQWCASPTDPDLELIEAVAGSGAPPVYMDMGGALLLRPDGEVLCLPWGELEKLAPESDAGWRLTALVVGADKYPELRPLLPVRPSGTADCEACKGGGRIRIEGSGNRRGPICGRCYGLGWLSAAS
jgi:hypothetical protein